MTLQVTGYTTKKDLKTCIGKRLQYKETSVFGTEYRSNGTFAVVKRPSPLNRREFFAEVTMQNDLIVKVV